MQLYKTAEQLAKIEVKYTLKSWNDFQTSFWLNHFHNYFYNVLIFSLVQ